MRQKRSRKINRLLRALKLAASLAASAVLLSAWGGASAQDTLPDGVPRPLRVGVAVFLNDAGKISEQAGSYEASIDVRYRWRDPSLAFKAKEAGGDRLEFSNEAATEKLRKMWSPRLTIANQLGT